MRATAPCDPTLAGPCRRTGLSHVPPLSTHGKHRMSTLTARAHRSYCICFAAGVYCNGCNCKGCTNTPEHQEVVMQERQRVLQRSPHAFQAKASCAGNVEGIVSAWVYACHAPCAEITLARLSAQPPRQNQHVPPAAVLASRPLL